MTAHREQRLLQTWSARGTPARLLWPVSLAYGALVRLRALAYRWGLRASHRLPVPVIVVGNLIAGGAGKTPVVLALIERLRQQGWSVGVISRGYGRQGDGVTEVTHRSNAAEVGDEPLLLQRRSRVPVVVGRDRVQAARHLLQAHPAVNLVLSDDGLQHTALQRDIQVVVFDERGAGNGWLLPAGPLREPLPAACPPHTLVLYNAAQPSTPLPGHLGHRRLQGLVAWSDWQAGQPASPQALQELARRTRQHPEAPAWATAGIAQPERFFELLRQAGVQITGHPLPDHHDFKGDPPWPQSTADVVVTEKDAVKLDAAALGAARVWVAPLDFTLDASFVDALAALMHSLSLHPTLPRHHGPSTA